MRMVAVKIFDVLEDGFPSKDEAVAFFWGGDINTGWPLIDTDNSYPGESKFASPEQARERPLNVLWETSEFGMAGTNVRYWFNIPALQKAEP
jgi:hypothetical protein